MAQDIVVGLDQCWAGHRAARLGLGAAAAGRAEKAGVFFAQGHDHLRLSDDVTSRINLVMLCDQYVLGAVRSIRQDELSSVSFLA